MLRIALLASVLLGCSSTWAQVRLGLRGGASISARDVRVETFSYAARDYRLSVDDVRVGVHAGAFLQARLGKVVLQPELLFHATSTDYRLEELLTTETLSSIRRERISTVELPFLIGYRWGALRLQAGPVGRTSVAQSSELSGIADYAYDARDVEFGYQAGLGLDIWRFLLDVKYDGAFAEAGGAAEIGGQQLVLGRRRHRTYVTLGWALFGGRG